jgi:hypothetical protein
MHVCELPTETDKLDQDGGNPDNGYLPDDQAEGISGGTSCVGLCGTSGSKVVSALPVGTASVGQAGSVCNNAVASQPERMTLALT